MKRYSVYITFNDSKNIRFESIDNPLEIEPVHVNGAEIVMTKDQYVINLLHVKNIEVSKLD